MATPAAAGERARARPARVDAEPAVVELLHRHGGRLMSVARRYSDCREDAEDAYQRAVEILLVRAPSTDPAHLLPWMKTVVKHEAFAVAKQRSRGGTPSEEHAIEPHVGLADASHEVAERRERLRLGAEALGRLKPQEVRALLLRADGLSYREICAATGWTYTKVNRCLSEGRQSFVDRVAGIERGAECERLAPLVSVVADGEGTAEQVAALRPHLSGCLACRARLREYRRAPARAAAAVAPVGVLGGVRWLLHGAAAPLQGAVAQKAAIVAASVAVAGGGVAVVGDAPQSGAPRPGSVARSGPPAAGAPAGLGPGPLALAPLAAASPARWPPAAPRSAPPDARRRTRSDRRLRRGSRRRRSTSDRAAARTPDRAGPRAPPRATGEFTPTPAPTRAPQPRRAPAPPPPRDPPGGEFAP